MAVKNYRSRHALPSGKANDAAWHEDDHPRGQPGNAGQFASAGGNNDLNNPPQNVKISATGRNKMYKRGFINEDAEKHHWGGGGTHDHSSQYKQDGIVTFDQYIDRACELLESQCVSGGIRGFATIDGYICRYDPYKNDYVVGHPLIGIRTMFKPTKGAAYYEFKRKKGGQ
ncbi:hypothetical protein [Phascolarctobacterium succinatutens]|uniref:hypothetical protein n=1 Tax=Phascolarctobacterium succinatutens TaxID=626940 RepID=UPI0025E00903|nr:hypothetical protein [Phascolarctobacterium succinatutens]